MPDKQTLSTWQAELADSITDVRTLFSHLGLDESHLPQAQAASQLFKCKVPRSYLSRIKAGDPHDPLLLELLPQGDELIQAPGYTATPLEEDRFNPIPGLLHKYHGRVLIVMTRACAIHCRYCFRRSFEYEDNRLTPDHWKDIVDYVASRPEIHEVIFSGGDPFVINDSILKKRIADLEAIPHIQLIRFHTRLPILIPERITPAFLEMVEASRLSFVIAFHINHPNALQDEVLQTKLAACKKAGVTLLNQGILLRGINDNPQVLSKLSYTLFQNGILPYYMHLLDRVTGSHHFEVSEPEAISLIKELMRVLPGYLVPKLVREVPGFPNKMPIAIG